MRVISLSLCSVCAIERGFRIVLFCGLQLLKAFGEPKTTDTNDLFSILDTFAKDFDAAIIREAARRDKAQKASEAAAASPSRTSGPAGNGRSNSSSNSSGGGTNLVDSIYSTLAGPARQATLKDAAAARARRGGRHRGGGAPPKMTVSPTAATADSSTSTTVRQMTETADGAPPRRTSPNARRRLPRSPNVGSSSSGGHLRRTKPRAGALTLKRGQLTGGASTAARS